MCVRVNVCECVYVWGRVYVGMCACVHVRRCVCMYVCMRVGV